MGNSNNRKKEERSFKQKKNVSILPEHDPDEGKQVDDIGLGGGLERNFFPDDIVYVVSRRYKHVIEGRNIWKFMYDSRWGIDSTKEISNYGNEARKQYTIDLQHNPILHFRNFYFSSEEVSLTMIPCRLNKTKEGTAINEKILSTIGMTGFRNDDQGFEQADSEEVFWPSTPSWFRKGKFELVYASKIYNEDYEECDGVFLVLQTEDDTMINTYSVSTDGLNFSNIKIHPLFPESKPNHLKSDYLSRIIHDRYLHFAGDGLFDISDTLLERSVEFLLSLRGNGSYVPITASKRRILKHRSLFNPTTTKLTTNEMARYIMCLENSRCQEFGDYRFKRNTKYQEFDSEKHINEKYFKETEKSKEIKEIKVFDREKAEKLCEGESVTVKITKQEEWDENEFRDEFVVFIGELVLYEREYCPGMIGSCDDYISEIRLVITGKRILIQKRLLRWIYDEGCPLS